MVRESRSDSKKRKPAHRNISFEIFNEASNVASYNTNQAVLAQIYNQCAVAIKAVDPRAVVGGPAVAGPQKGSWQVFIQNAAANLDFYTVHIYPVPNSLVDTNKTIYLNAQSVTAAYLAQTISYLHQASPSRNIPVIVDEYNINGAYQVGTDEPRQQTNVGAVADVVVNIQALLSGAYATAAWSDFGNPAGHYFSHIQSNYSPYPNGNALMLLNDFFVGDITKSTSPDPTQLVTLSCKSTKGKCLLIANENPTATPVSLDCGKALKAGGTYLTYTIDANGFRSANLTGSALLTQVNLSADSVTVVILGK